MSIETVLIVDDEPLIRSFLIETLKRKKFQLQEAANVKEALKKISKHHFDLVITDMKMPDGTGLDVLKKLHQHSPESLSLVMTAFATVQNAVEAMQLGAFNYLIKPFSADTIETMIEKASSHSSLIHENCYLKQEVEKESSYKDEKIVTRSSLMKNLLQQAERVAKSHANVFIVGESGTGKEVIAKFVHRHSLRVKHPYICVNCAAIPETLIESEFFGHEKGSFTGAVQKKLGRFELAHRGSLLLDEVTEIPVAMQAKLLRAIQEKKFERVGGSRLIESDVRFISTSNRNLLEAIEEKVFREDLYYRLNVIPIYIPPLRERREDILPLARYFLKRTCLTNRKGKKRLSPSAEKKLEEYHWPGNIRELANIMERVVVMDISEEVAVEHLSLHAFSTKKIH